MQLSKEFPKWSQLDHEKTVSSFPRFVKKKRHENHFIESKIHSIQEREKLQKSAKQEVANVLCVILY